MCNLTGLCPSVGAVSDPKGWLQMTQRMDRRTRCTATTQPLLCGQAFGDYAAVVVLRLGVIQSVVRRPTTQPAAASRHIEQMEARRLLATNQH